MLFLRSLAFNVAFYAHMILWLFLLIPAALLPRRGFMQAVKLWGLGSLWLMRILAGTRFEVRGREKIPAGGLIVASKHQSFWETFALVPLFDDPTYILKRELMWIPLFGWFLAKAGCVPVDRKAGSRALIQMNARAREEAQGGRQIIIFPEGTRRPAGAPPAYKFGVAHLYESLGVPCQPVAVNSGLYWPRRSFLRHPGTVVLEILDPIAPGLPKDAFFRELQARIETASDRLLAEGRADLARAAQG
jgi:1-acyl-sn-glycerol-3-phosphate acyltransferase